MQQPTLFLAKWGVTMGEQRERREAKREERGGKRGEMQQERRE